ncbi:MAG: hypothetical protein AAF228_11690 [Pseudomonadota bacterium]
MDINFAVGQCWRYQTLANFEESRIIVGHIEPFENVGEIICISVTHAPIPRQNGNFLQATIPFMPFSRQAIEQTVTELDTITDVPPDFNAGFENWKNDPDGFGFLQVPFMVLLTQISDDLIVKPN